MLHDAVSGEPVAVDWEYVTTVFDLRKRRDSTPGDGTHIFTVHGAEYLVRETEDEVQAIAWEERMKSPEVREYFEKAFRR